jgi:hypothetical protein
MSLDKTKLEAAAPKFPCEHVVFTDLDGLEGVLVDLNTKKYYQLNETASLIWRGLQKRLLVSDIAAEITAHYNVTLENATSSVEKIVRYLQDQCLISSQKSC